MGVLLDLPGAWIQYPTVEPTAGYRGKFEMGDRESFADLFYVWDQLEIFSYSTFQHLGDPGIGRREMDKRR